MTAFGTDRLDQSQYLPDDKRRAFVVQTLLYYIFKKCFLH